MIQGSQIACEIERDRKEKSSKLAYFDRRKNMKGNKFRQCICLVCGSEMEMLTDAHAEKHGYKNKKDLIKSGMILWKN